MTKWERGGGGSGATGRERARRKTRWWRTKLGTCEECGYATREDAIEIAGNCNGGGKRHKRTWNALDLWHMFTDKHFIGVFCLLILLCVLIVLGHRDVNLLN
jgi:hypothetical protein